MNLWQVCNQVQHLLQQRVWPGTATKVFFPESVLVIASDSDIDALDANVNVPAAFISPGPGQSDPQANDEPGYRVEELTVVLAVHNSADRTGQSPIMGASRGGVSDSRGRGLLELEEQLLSTIELLNVQEGVTIAFKAQGAPVVRADASNKTYALRAYTFEVSCTSALFYPPCRRFSATPGTSSVALAWSLPSARYDRYRVVLRRASGSVAPTSITDGTGVTLASNLATSVEDIVSPGTYSYALFMVYDDFGRSGNAANPGQDLRSSDELTETGVVVS